MPPSVTIVGDDIFGKAGGEILQKNVKGVCSVERVSGRGKDYGLTINQVAVSHSNRKKPLDGSSSVC